MAKVIIKESPERPRDVSFFNIGCSTIVISSVVSMISYLFIALVFNDFLKAFSIDELTIGQLLFVGIGIPILLARIRAESNASVESRRCRACKQPSTLEKIGDATRAGSGRFWELRSETWQCRHCKEVFEFQWEVNNDPR